MEQKSLVEWFYDSLPPCALAEPFIHISGEEQRHEACVVCAPRRRVLRAIPLVFSSYKRGNSATAQGEGSLTNSGCAELCVAPVPVLLRVSYGKCVSGIESVSSSSGLTCSAFMDDVCCELITALAGGPTVSSDAVSGWLGLLEDATESLGLGAVLGISGGEHMRPSQTLVFSQNSAACCDIEDEHGVKCLFPVQRWIEAVQSVCSAGECDAHLPSCPVRRRTVPVACNSMGGGTNSAAETHPNVLESRVSWLVAVEVFYKCLAKLRLPHVTPVCKERDISNGLAGVPGCSAAHISTLRVVVCAVRSNLVLACRNYVNTAMGCPDVLPADDEVALSIRCAVVPLFERLLRHRCSNEEAVVNGKDKRGCCCFLLVPSLLVKAAAEILVGENEPGIAHAELFFTSFVRVLIEVWQQQFHEVATNDMERLEWISRLYCYFVYQLQIKDMFNVAAEPLARVVRILVQQYVCIAAPLLNVKNWSCVEESAASLASWLLDVAVRGGGKSSFPLNCYRRCDCSCCAAIGVMNSGTMDESGEIGVELLLREMVVSYCGSESFPRAFIKHSTAARKGRLGISGPAPEPSAALAELRYCRVVVASVGHSISDTNSTPLDGSSVGVNGAAHPIGGVGQRNEWLEFFRNWGAEIRGMFMH
uniref:Uncharacterized protein n=1 Tax=Trypanosoma congolense (strain IL3000) TaxID=1068625 RepID=G0UQF1_TRYCI|nr:conserved hypothetical protein [Trypanosoma congolense IL3000]